MSGERFHERLIDATPDEWQLLAHGAVRCGDAVSLFAQAQSPSGVVLLASHVVASEHYAYAAATAETDAAERCWTDLRRWNVLLLPKPF